MARKSLHLTGLALSALVASLSLGDTARAAEYAKGVYLLGFSSNFAGFVPPPGGYVESDTYFYDGSAGADVDLPLGGVLAAGVDATLVLEVVSGTYVFPRPVLGGLFGVFVLLPFGWEEIRADATLDSPILPPIALGVKQDDFQVGDPLLGALLGWHMGNWHWSITTFVNIPVGQYDPDRLVNLGFNRWAVDVKGAVTWLDLALGLEASTAAGFTFNGDNLSLDYKTGTEFHLEFAGSKIFANGMSIGLAGYYYQQITGDSGSDDRVGSFEGRVVALGPVVGLTIPLADRKLTTRLRWYHEFDAKNRLEGDAVFLTAAVPLQAEAPPPHTK